MDKELFEQLKNSNSLELYEQAKKLCSSLGLSPAIMNNIISSPDDLKRKLSSMSIEQLNSLTSSIDKNTLSQIEKALRSKGESNGN